MARAGFPICLPQEMLPACPAVARAAWRKKSYHLLVWPPACTSIAKGSSSDLRRGTAAGEQMLGLCDVMDINKTREGVPQRLETGGWAGPTDLLIDHNHAHCHPAPRPLHNKCAVLPVKSNTNVYSEERHHRRTTTHNLGRYYVLLAPPNLPSPETLCKVSLWLRTIRDMHQKLN